MKLVTRKSECKTKKRTQIVFEETESRLVPNQDKNCIFIKQIKYVSKDNEVLEFTGVTSSDNTMLLMINHHLL